MTKDDIEAEYYRLGYTLGWSFIYGPASTMRTSKYAIVGLNPGGRKPHCSKWSEERGSSWKIEEWEKRGGGRLSAGEAPLQKQIQCLCDGLRATPDDTFSAQFVPFRSPSWRDLLRKKEALDFARKLWTWAIEETSARTFICIGKGVVPAELAKLIGATKRESIPIEWGAMKLSASLYCSPNGKKIVGLPHLSRYKLFSCNRDNRALLAAIR